MCRSIGNVLEPVTWQLHPEVAVLKEQMKRFGADAVLMSGSGPTVFGLVKHESRVPTNLQWFKRFLSRSLRHSNVGRTSIHLLKYVYLWYCTS